MSVKITYFVHGTTFDNEQDLATGWLPGELSPTGRSQANDLGKQVKHIKFDAILSSDLHRAVESAEIGFGYRYHIIQDKRLRECNYGDFNGQPHTFKANLADYISQPFPGGESYQDVEARMRSFVESARRNYDGRYIAIVAHQAPQLALDVILRGRTWEQAIAEDWRPRKAWQPGWDYVIT